MITILKDAPTLMITEGGTIATVGIAEQNLELPDDYLIPAWSELGFTNPQWKKFVASVFPNLDEVILFLDPQRRKC